MKYDTKKYSRAINVGESIQTKDGRIREVVKIDGRHIYFADGSKFTFSHPDLVSVLVPKDTKGKRKKAQESDTSDDTERETEDRDSQEVSE